MQKHDSTLQRTIGIALALIVGFVPAFFIVFHAQISDVPPQSFAVDHVVYYALAVLVSYAVAGAAFGYMEPKRAAGWGLWLGLPVLFPLAVAAVRERQRTIEILLYACSRSAARLRPLTPRPACAVPPSSPRICSLSCRGARASRFQSFWSPPWLRA